MKTYGNLDITHNYDFENKIHKVFAGQKKSVECNGITIGALEISLTNPLI